ncbi:MAG: aminotransferase class I/II-fold pyridoxal phosphate-dependent enzyme [Selenomonadaceae bacterium]|nr:aminotransferase class I/II-fold pyridoxal phosphate-dependent enzyme [Selenomonadaceae bacterium]
MERYEHGGRVYDANGKIGDWLDFSANINPLGLSEKILRTLEENLCGVVNYPDPNATELKIAIAERYGVSEKNLVLLNGAAEFFYLYLNLMRYRRVIIPVPSFAEYERAARAARCEVKYFMTDAADNFAPNIDKLCAEVTGKDCVILGRPNNPTGNLIAPEKILRLAEVTNVLVDESFIDFIDAPSLRKFVSAKISVVQSLTKIFAIPGLRLGFAVVAEDLAQRLNMAKDVWNVNFLAQKVGAAALTDEEYLRQTRMWLTTEREYFIGRLKAMGVEFIPPSVNFVLMKFPTIDRAEKILQGLRREKILLRSCGNFVGLDESYLRSAVRSHDENLRLLDTIEKLLEVM